MDPNKTNDSGVQVHLRRVLSDFWKFLAKGDKRNRESRGQNSSNVSRISGDCNAVNQVGKGNESFIRGNKDGCAQHGSHNDSCTVGNLNQVGQEGKELESRINGNNNLHYQTSNSSHQSQMPGFEDEDTQDKAGTGTGGNESTHSEKVGILKKIMALFPEEWMAKGVSD